MKKSKNVKISANAEIKRIVERTINGVSQDGYVEVIVRVGTQWRRLFFPIEKPPQE